MKSIVSILLSVLILTPYLTRTGIFIDFKINQDHITKNLCVDKKIPMSNCDGKCYLADLLQKTDKEDGKNQVPGKNEREQSKVVFYIPKCGYQSATTNALLLNKTKNLFYYSFYIYNYTVDVFHPPKFHLA